MAHTIYNNEVLSNKVKGFLDTNLDMSTFYTHDDSLTESAGMKKTINVYDATGQVRTVLQGEGNLETDDVAVSFTPVEYTVGTTQGRLVVFDEEIMKDPMTLDTGLSKLSANMTNEITSKFYVELGKTTQTMEYPIAGINFDVVVDATALFGENEEGLYMLINPAQKAQLRKTLKDDLKYSEGFTRTGYIGSINNIPVYTSNAVPADTAFIASPEAVTVFTKKEVEIEQERDANLRKTSIYNRMVNVVALTDNSKAVKLTKALA